MIFIPQLWYKFLTVFHLEAFTLFYYFMMVYDVLTIFIIFYIITVLGVGICEDLWRYLLLLGLGLSLPFTNLGPSFGGCSNNIIVSEHVHPEVSIAEIIDNLGAHGDVRIREVLGAVGRQRDDHLSSILGNSIKIEAVVMRPKVCIDLCEDRLGF